jgi:hypothetical protein
MKRSQRMGLGLVALFYGELAAIPVGMLIVLLRFPSNWQALVKYPGFAISTLLTVSVFQGLIAAITWSIFGLAMLVLWPTESMRRHMRWTYATALPLGLLAPALLGTTLFFIHRKDPRTHLMDWPIFLETFSFMLVCSLGAIFWYFRLSEKAETLLAVKKELQSRQK